MSMQAGAAAAASTMAESMPAEAQAPTVWHEAGRGVWVQSARPRQLRGPGVIVASPAGSDRDGLPLLAHRRAVCPAAAAAGATSWPARP